MVGTLVLCDAGREAHEALIGEPSLTTLLDLVVAQPIESSGVGKPQVNLIIGIRMPYQDELGAW